MNEFGNPISQSALNVDITKIVDRINTDGTEFIHMSPHTLRHTFATRGIVNCIPPKVNVLPDTKANEIKKIAGLVILKTK